MANQSFKNLTVYKKAFELAMMIFNISKRFPKEEKYSLTDQLRRSSRSVAVCIAEAYRKRNYAAYFISKSSDADMEKVKHRFGSNLPCLVNTLLRMNTTILSIERWRLED